MSDWEGDKQAILGWCKFVLILSFIFTLCFWGRPMKMSHNKDVEAIKTELISYYGDSSNIEVISIGELGEYKDQHYQTVDYVLNDSINKTCLMGVDKKFLRYECGNIIDFNNY